jgi:hypothetical protein
MKTFLTVAIAAVLLVPQSNSTGVVYTARMEKFGKKSSFSVWATDAKAKFSVSESNDPRMPAGISIIALDRGERYILTDSEKQTFIELTRDQYKELMRHQADVQGFKFEDSGLEELVVDSDGGLVAGNETRYFKLRISIRGTHSGQPTMFIANEEFWTAPSLPNPMPSLDMLTEQVSGVDQIDRLLDYKKFKGYPLKRLIKLYEDGQYFGQSLVEITKIVQVPIDESVFTVPSEYTKMNVPGSQVQ